jgi:pimeloyl-ACP methyl ester carboxylesterase/ketosteroid isomerase-like protein
MSPRTESIGLRPADERGVLRVRSGDGTEICCRQSGEGWPPLVLVHGTTADHARWRPLLPYLEPRMAVFAIDRRGRGRSGDSAEYSVEREFEDVAAAVDAVAQVSGSAVDVLGHSFGGLCALGGALLTDNLRRLVLYEPPLAATGDALPPGIVARLEALLAAGDREGVVETFIREVVGMPEHEFDTYRALPAWPARVAAAHTIPRELAADLGGTLDLERLAHLRVPTLLLAGGDSPAWMRADTDAVAAALPEARTAVLEGQQHIAIDLVPERFADAVLGFLRDDRRATDPVSVVERYFAVVADLDSSAEELRSVLHPAVRIVEHPNAINPRGTVRNRKAAVAGFLEGKRLLSAQTIELHETLAVGDRVAVRATWCGTIGRGTERLPAGTELVARIAAMVTVADGLIREHETFDCYEPLPAA